MLSVITPTFNGMSKGLGRSINSVLQIDLVQEYIIIVDGSNDSSYEFCKDLKKKDSRIKLISNDNNLGWTYSVSKAIDSISNKWITIHNDDYLLLPNFNNLINFTSQNDLDLCYCKYAIGNDQVIDASFGYFIMPIISVFLGYFFLKEELSFKTKISLLIVTISILYLVLSSFQSIFVTFEFSILLVGRCHNKSKIVFIFFLLNNWVVFFPIPLIF